MLDFTFIAELYNGTIIRQTPDDKSQLDPLNRSAYYDVLHVGNPVKKLSLIGKGHMFVVDLVDGHIEVDGNKLYPPKAIPQGATLKPIYYCQVQQRMGIEYELNPDGIQIEKKVLKPITRYFIGWQIPNSDSKWEIGVD
jgi:hypothetical protein